MVSDGPAVIAALDDVQRLVFDKVARKTDHARVGVLHPSYSNQNILMRARSPMVRKSSGLPKGHPFSVVKKIINRYGHDLQFEFGKYIYRPGSLADERRFEFVDARDMTSAHIIDIIDALPSKRELSLHSRITTAAGEVKHIPMIDFDQELKQLTKDPWHVINIQSKYLPRKLFGTLHIFETDHSYHGYGTTLLTHEEWIWFMGTLLIFNQKCKHPIVDARWIGHRLRGGFASLRWSCNTTRYQRYPRFVPRTGYG